MLFEYFRAAKLKDLIGQAETFNPLPIIAFFSTSSVQACATLINNVAQPENSTALAQDFEKWHLPTIQDEPAKHPAS